MKRLYFIKRLSIELLFRFSRIFVAMMKIKRIVFTAVLLCVLFACTGPNEYKMAMSHVDSVMSKRPDSALLILDTLGRHETEFGKHFKMRYLLRLALAQAKTVEISFIVVYTTFLCRSVKRYCRGFHGL
ncbi:MAG: hypothetical protein IJS43_04075 [Bacteroidaceae bacterium]|nr:hypothetical protein [Bacteroidaceae bacterium]